MSTAATTLTDHRALERQRARARVHLAAAPSGKSDAFFLQHLVADDLQDRLSVVNRSFTRPAVVTPFPEFWQARLPRARIVADSELLDLEPGAHDLVIHALALHWAEDPPGQIIQCAEALEPDGMCMVALFGGRTLHELRSVLAEAEAAQRGGLSPRVLPMAEIRELGALLQRARLALPVADSLPQQVSYADAFALMAELRAMGEGNALAGRARRFTARSVLLDAAARYAAHFPDPERPGRIRATFEIVTLTGWKPHPSQSQPLRPGSAQARLAEALGGAEIPLTDQADPDEPAAQSG